FMRLHFVFCDDAAATEIYTPSLLDALPISSSPDGRLLGTGEGGELGSQIARPDTDLVEWSDSDKVRQRRTERNCGGFRGEAPGGSFSVVFWFGVDLRRGGGLLESGPDQAEMPWLGKSSRVGVCGRAAVVSCDLVSACLFLCSGVCVVVGPSIPRVGGGGSFDRHPWGVGLGLSLS